MVPPQGSKIEVEYVIHDGKKGNLDDSNDLTLKWQASGEDSLGTSHDLNNFLDITVTSSPKMGTDKESTQFTKIMTPPVSYTHLTLPTN